METLLTSSKEDNNHYYELLGQVLAQARRDYLRYVAMINNKIKKPNEVNYLEHVLSGKDAEEFFFKGERLEEFLKRFELHSIEPSFLRNGILKDVEFIEEETKEQNIHKIIGNTIGKKSHHRCKQLSSNN
jgi:hypothetical protein